MSAEPFRWRPLSPRDLGDVMAVAEVVHAAYPERRESFADKLALAPDCCFGLAGANDVLAGYAVALPWTRGETVALDAMLGQLPARCDALYIHDIAILPAARGRGLAGTVVTLLAEVARRHDVRAMTLTAVYGAEAVWARHGFHPVETAALRAKLASYGSEARYMERLLG